jgi:hypothetical protein
MTSVLLLATLFLAEPSLVVHVSREPATAQRVTFDPKEPQSHITKLKNGENAVTESRFDAHCELTHEVISTSQDQVAIRITSARIALSLDTTIYLPNDVRPPLRVHEEGHRVINERIHDREANAIAGEAVDALLAKEWKATSAALAIAQAENECRAAYRQRIMRRAIEVNERFDALTAHGKNDEPKVVDAIEQAFSSATAKPTTQPSTTATSNR